MDNDTLDKFTDSQFYTIFDYEEAQLSQAVGLCPVNNPAVYLLGGQSGAGKTTLHNIISAELNDNVIIIDGDSFRSLHPNSVLLDKKYGKNSVMHKSGFSNRMVEELISSLSSKSYNLIVEGTLRNVDTPCKTATLLKSKHYSVELLIMAVKPIISYYSTTLRYEQMKSTGKSPRATDKKYHDAIVDVLPSNVDLIYTDNLRNSLFDNIRIYNRERACMYSRNDTPKINPRDIIEEVFYGKWTNTDKNMLYGICNDIEKYMGRRGSEELNNFIKQKKELITLIENLDSHYYDSPANISGSVQTCNLKEWKNDVVLRREHGDSFKHADAQHAAHNSKEQ